MDRGNTAGYNDSGFYNDHVSGTRAFDFGGTVSYQYDKHNRITSESSSGMGIVGRACTYEDGKLKTRGARTYNYNVQGQRIGWTEGGQSVTYGYDNYGNVTNKGGAVLTYNSRNMLASCGSTEYRYNHQGVRFEKTAGNTTREYCFDGARLLGEKAGNEYKNYYYDATGICGMKYYGLELILVRDALGNVIKLYQGDALLGEYDYDAWGNCKATSYNTDGTVSNGGGFADINPFRWKGYYYDSESGLYAIYTGGKTRYYDPQLGQFLDASDIGQLDIHSIGGLDRNGLGVANPLLFPKNGDTIFSSVDYANGTAVRVQEGTAGGGSGNTLIRDIIHAADRYVGISDNFFSVVTAAAELKYPLVKRVGRSIALVAGVVSTTASWYDNFTNPSLSEQEKWTHSIADTAYVWGSIGVSAFTAWGAAALFGLAFGPAGWVVVAGTLIGIGTAWVLQAAWDEWGDDVKKWFNSLFD